MWWGRCLLVSRWPGRDLSGSLKDEIYPTWKSVGRALREKQPPSPRMWMGLGWDHLYTYMSLFGIGRPEWCSLRVFSRLLAEGSQAGEEGAQEETEIHILSSLWITTAANLMSMDLRWVGVCALFSICSRISELGLSFRTAALRGAEVCKEHAFRVTTQEVKIAQVLRSQSLWVSSLGHCSQGRHSFRNFTRDRKHIIRSKLSGSGVPRVTGSHGTQLGIGTLGTSLWIPGRAVY